MKRKEQLLPENLRHQRTGRSRGHVAENADWRKGTETTEREALDSMVWKEGQSAWRAGKVEKLKPGCGELEVNGVEDGLSRRTWS